MLLKQNQRLRTWKIIKWISIVKTLILRHVHMGEITLYNFNRRGCWCKPQAASNSQSCYFPIDSCENFSYIDLMEACDWMNSHDRDDMKFEISFIKKAFVFLFWENWIAFYSCRCVLLMHFVSCFSCTFVDAQLIWVLSILSSWISLAKVRVILFVCLETWLFCWWQIITDYAIYFLIKLTHTIEIEWNQNITYSTSFAANSSTSISASPRRKSF